MINFIRGTIILIVFIILSMLKGIGEKHDPLSSYLFIKLWDYFLITILGSYLYEERFKENSLQLF